jgi:hypothetical protein
MKKRTGEIDWLLGVTGGEGGRTGDGAEMQQSAFARGEGSIGIPTKDYISILPILSTRSSVDTI